VKQPATSGTPEDRLVAEGEKYLYGDGVPQNCARAQRNLTSAARRLNVKAQSLLGTMYATGHCAQRDLPTAYRWFAKALHQDPTNDRIQRDLEALWREMTPDERQIAMRNQ
jgi:TPR repeat protein